MPLKKLCIELTDYCNLNCDMCYRKTWTHAAGHMNFKLLDSLLLQIQQSDNLTEIVLGGIGEPTCHPRFNEVLKTLKDYQLSVTTNGTTLGSDICENLARFANRIVVSIDGTAEQFQRIRGYDYLKLTQNLKKLQDLRGIGGNRHELVIQMVLSSQNEKDVPDIIALCAELQASELILSNLVPVTVEQTCQILYTQGDNGDMLLKQRHWRNLAMRKGLALKLTESKLKTDRYCRFIEQQAGVITAGGELVPCYRLAHEGTEFVFGRPKQISRYSFGNLAEEKLENIWASEAYKVFRNMVKGNRYPSCPDCDLSDGCDYVNNTEGDCYGNGPSCADCLWSRNIVYCV